MISAFESFVIEKLSLRYFAGKDNGIIWIIYLSKGEESAEYWRIWSHVGVQRGSVNENSLNSVIS